MNVVAIATPAERGWRWRIVNYAGEVVEESRSLFSTIKGAVTDGAQRLHELDVTDVSRPAPYRSPYHPRRRWPKPD